jgi:hypothetical protein
VSATGYVALLICGLTAAAVAAMAPFLTAGLPARDQCRRPVLALVVAVIAVLIATARVRGIALDTWQIVGPVTCSFALVVGILAEWIRETLWGDRLDANALCAGLLAAAVSIGWCGSALGEHLDAATLARWAIWGGAWQAACAWWFGALRPPAPARRRDPPDLGVGGCHADLWRKYPRA